MKKKMFSILMLVLALTGLTACSELTEMESAGNAGKPVLLSIGSGVSTTRAEGNNYASAFQGNEQVTVAMKDLVTSEVTRAVYNVGVPDGSGKSVLTPAGAGLVYPNHDVSLYAVYPSGSMDGHTVEKDQTLGTGYWASDLFYATTNVLTENMGQMQHLPFSHQLTKLYITVKNPKKLSVGSITLHNVKRKVSYGDTMGENALTLTVDETDDGDNTIEFGNFMGTNSEEESVWSCVLPAQTWNSGDTFLSITVMKNGSHTATYKLGADASFVNGQVYTLTIDLSPMALGQTMTLTSDWPGNSVTTIPTTAKLTIDPISSKTYTGDKIELTEAELIVKDGDGNELKINPTGDNPDGYTVEYRNNINVGTAYVIVTGVGFYEGFTAIATFQIVAP